MYRAVKLVPEDKDLYRFVWRENTTEPLIDYRMTRITFGVSASSRVLRLELCGTKLLAQLLHHTSKALEIPLSHVHAWCDSTIVLSWLDGSPRKFKTFVGNRVSAIVDLIPPSHRKYVPTGENPADRASRGLLPSELITHHIWWKGPKRLQQSPDYWPHYSHLPITVSEEERDVTLIANSVQNETISPLIDTQTSRNSNVSLPGS